jgi:hypothetical protein
MRKYLDLRGRNPLTLEGHKRAELKLSFRTLHIQRLRNSKSIETLLEWSKQANLLVDGQGI